MKQEKEAQSRFLISLRFFYWRRWMRPDDEFSLICFRPISEKTRTTSLPLPSILPFTERGPQRPVLQSETSHLNSLQQSRQRSRISIRTMVEWRTTPLSRTNGFGIWNVTRWTLDVDITNEYPRKTNNSFPQCLFHLMKFPCTAGKIEV